MNNSLNPVELETAMHRVHRAGMPGVIAEVRDGDQVWRGAAGVADVSTSRPISSDMRHRVGSITKNSRPPRFCSKSKTVRSRSTRRSATTCRRWCPANAALRLPSEC